MVASTQVNARVHFMKFLSASRKNGLRSVSTHYWPWIVIGVGCVLLLALVLLGNVFVIGERLGRFSVNLEVYFYILIGALLYLMLVHPLIAIVIRPRMLLHPFLGVERTMAAQNSRSTAKTLLRYGGLSDSARSALKLAWANDELLAEAIGTVLNEKNNEADSIIVRHAQLAFISTAVSQNGSLDAVMLAYTNLKLIRNLVQHYACRPSVPQLARMYSQVVTCALIAQRLEDLEIEDIFPQFGASLGGSVASWVPGLQLAVTAFLQGMGSALLTLRMGIIAKEYILNGGEEFSPSMARKSASRQAAKLLIEVVISSSPRLPSILRGLVKLFKFSDKEPVRKST